MENTQSLDIMYIIVLSINTFLVSRRPWIIKTAILNQSMYFKIILTSKFKS